MSDGSYAGDVTSAEAFEILEQDGDAVLVDVRTTPEWQFVGVPDLRGIGKETVFLSWQAYPQMAVHTDFASALRAQGVGPEHKVLLLCRSGQRSRSAAMALTAAGYGQAYNVSDGFEGRLDSESHRGKAEGWKAAGLPWVQQ